MSEDLSQGERVEAFVLEVWASGSGWREVARGTNIGHRRILRFAPVTASRLRLRVLSSRATPYLGSVSAHLSAR